MTIMKYLSMWRNKASHKKNSRYKVKYLISTGNDRLEFHQENKLLLGISLSCSKKKLFKQVIHCV